MNSPDPAPSRAVAAANRSGLHAFRPLSATCNERTRRLERGSSHIYPLMHCGTTVNALSLSRHLTIVHPMEIAVSGPSDNDELAALVGQARSGNAAAFEELARRLRLRIRGWAHRIVG